MNDHSEQGLSTEQQRQFDSLEHALKEGFAEVIAELRSMREQGSVPAPVVNKLLDAQKVYFLSVIRVLCTTLVLVVIWFTGLKTFLPQIAGAFQ